MKRKKFFIYFFRLPIFYLNPREHYYPFFFFPFFLFFFFPLLFISSTLPLIFLSFQMITLVKIDRVFSHRQVFSHSTFHGQNFKCVTSLFQSCWEDLTGEKKKVFFLISNNFIVFLIKRFTVEVCRIV